MNKHFALYNSMFRSYPDIVSVEIMCAMLGGISRKLAYKLLNTGEIQPMKIGRTYKIPKVYIIDYLVEQNCENRLLS